MRRYHLSESDQVYFLHIAKTAGSSLSNILNHFLWTKVEERPHYLPHDLLTPPETLVTDPLIVGHLFYSLHHFLMRPPIYLTILRDPVTQVMSHFLHIQRDPNSQFHRKFQGKTLLDFVRDPELEPIVANYQTRNLIVDGDFRAVAAATPMPVQKYPGFPHLMLAACVCDQALLDQAKARLREFAFVGIAERFEESIALLTYTFHWPSLREFERFNTAPNVLREEEIPAEAVAIIEAKNTLDRQLHRFGLELFESRLREMEAEVRAGGVPPSR